MEIEIINWDKYNPKRDQTTYTWLRLNNDFAADQKLYGLSPQQKYAFIIILCECSKHNASKITLEPEWLSYICSVSQTEINELLIYLEKKGIASVGDRTLPHTTADVRHTTPTNETNEHNERTNIIAQQVEQLYLKYPRKEGKTKGIQKLSKEMKTPEDLTLLEKSISNYTKVCGTEKKYIKHFSTFAGCWRDYLANNATQNKPKFYIEENHV